MAQAKKQVATKEQGALPAHLAKKMEEHSGEGVSSKQEDNLVPLVYILQAQSPQVNKRSADYIDGAEAGHIWLRNAPHPIVPGDTGILFQPCHFSKDWVEWVPRDNGGGFVARHEDRPPEAEETKDPQNPNRVKYVMPNGNEVIETRYHAGFVVLDDGSVLPYIIPMSSSGHSVSRQWMFMMNSNQLPKGDIAPSWSKLYRLKTKERSNAAGTWFTWDISDAGWVDEEAFDRGTALFNAFNTGEKKAETPMDQAGNEEEATM